MSDTFYMSNISPQIPQFNRGYWAKLEKYVRDLTKQYVSIEVFTGTLFLPHYEENGERWVKYRVIGENDVAVPTHFFKVLVLENIFGEKAIEAFILPNESIDSNIPFDNFKTTVQKIEKACGILFPL